MKHVLMCLFYVFTIVPTRAQETHPRLFFGPDDIQTIRARALDSNTTAGKLWKLIKERQADVYSQTTPTDGRAQLINDRDQHQNLSSLAFAHMITGDSIYVRRIKEIIFGYPGQMGLVQLSYTGSYANRVVGLAVSLDMLWDEFEPWERDSIIRVCVRDIATPNEYGLGLREVMAAPFHRHGNNWVAHKGIELLSAAIVFNGHPAYAEADSDIALIRYRVLTYEHNLIVRMYDPDGATLEGTYYGVHALRFQISLMHALGRWDNTDYFQMEPYKSRLEKVGSYFCYEVLPSPRGLYRYLNSINDSHKGFLNTCGLLAGLLLQAGVYSDTLSTWVFNNTIQSVQNFIPQGQEREHNWQYPNPSYCLIEALNLYDDLPDVEPAERLSWNRYYRERGLVYIRTSNTWADESDIQFSMTASPAFNPATGVFSQKHNQPDKNSITLSAFGKDFIVDIGYNGQRPEHQNYFLINGRGQAPDAFNGNVNDGRIADYLASSAFGIIHGDAKDAFDTHYYMGQDGYPVQVVDPTNAVENADRYVISVHPAASTRQFFVVGDDIQKNNSSNNYTWVFNTYYAVSGSNPVVINAGSGKQLKLWHTAASSVEVTSELVQLEPVQPSVPGEPFIDNSVEFFSAGLTVYAKNPYLHVLLLPYNTGDEDPIGVSFPSVSNGSCIKIQWVDHEDYSVFKRSAAISSSLVATDAKLSQVRKHNSSGWPVSFAAANGSYLTFDSRELINLYGSQGTVMMDGSDVFLYGSIPYFRVYAPNAMSVKLNGTPVAFVQVGDYVEPPKVTVDRTWSGVITAGNDITVAPGVTLTLAPGSSVRFKNESSIIVDGALVAEGTAQAPISFALGELIEYWNGIVLNPFSSATLDHCTIAQALVGISANSVMPSINHTRLELCQIGAHFFGSAGEIAGSTFSNNWTALIVDGEYGLLEPPAAVILTDNVFNLNGTGIYVTNASPLLEGNTITNNGTCGVWCSDGGNPFIGRNEVDMPGYNVFEANMLANLLAENYSFPFVGYREKEEGETYGGFNSFGPQGHQFDVWARGESGVMARRTYWSEIPPDEETSFKVGDGGPIEPENWIDWTFPLDEFSTGALASGESNEGVPQFATSPSALGFGLTDSGLRAAFKLRAQKKFSQAVSLIKQYLRTNVNSPAAPVAFVMLQQIVLELAAYTRDPSVRTLFHVYADSILASTQHDRLKRAVLALKKNRLIRSQAWNAAIAISSNISSQYPNTVLDMHALYAGVTSSLLGLQDKHRAQEKWSVLRQRYPEAFLTKVATSLLSISTLGGTRPTSMSSRVSTLAKGTPAHSQGVPHQFVLHPNYPNPFNPTTQINFDLPDASNVSLVIYDVLGREVATLGSGYREAGYHTATWNARPVNGARDVSSGVYFARFTASDVGGNVRYTKINKLVLMK